MEIEKELLRGHIDLVILAMLAMGDLYGYELAKRVKARTDGAFELKEGTLYLALKRLEQAGLVESYWGDGDVGARRKYYRLLSAGRQHVKDLAHQWTVLTQVTRTTLADAALLHPHPTDTGEPS